MKPASGRRVLNIAHRGAAALWPENTLYAFERALMSGCDGLELDVVLNAEGQAIVHHDSRLHADFTRRDGAWLEGQGPRLSELSARDMAAYTVGRPRPGSAYAEGHALLEPRDEPIPTLQAALDVFRRLAPADGLCLMELKLSVRRTPSPEAIETLAARAAEALDRADDERIVAVGFNWNVLLALKRLRPRTRLWFTTYPVSWFIEGAVPHDPPSPKKLDRLRSLYAQGAPWMGGYWPERFGGSIPRALEAAGVEGWLAYGPDMEDRSLKQARDLGLKIGVWDVNDADLMRRFIALGVDAICTDRPDIMIKTDPAGIQA